MLKFLRFFDSVMFVLSSAAVVFLLFVLQNLIAKLEDNCVKNLGQLELLETSALSIQYLLFLPKEMCVS